MKKLLILGASARSAAFSAIRAGYEPLAIDCFGDVDLTACCGTHRSADYPKDLPAIARQFEDCPWIYTGGLENHPDLVDRIALDRPLLGNRGDALRRVRNPFLLFDVLADSNIQCPELSRVPPTSGEWLRKPFKSCGGGNITRINEEQIRNQSKEDSRYYYQRFKEGTPCSALFLAVDGKAQLLGITKQLVRTNLNETQYAWTGAQPFWYAGSVGPVDLSEEQLASFEKIGSRVANEFARTTCRSTDSTCLHGDIRQTTQNSPQREFGLIGLFGLDAIINEKVVWPLEVNPRYTASVEIVERILGSPLLGNHIAACQSPRTIPRIEHMGYEANNLYHGKAVLYTDHDTLIGEPFYELDTQMNERMNKYTPKIADIPKLGAKIACGQPLVTIFASGESIREVEANLQIQATRVRGSLVS